MRDPRGILALSLSALTLAALPGGVGGGGGGGGGGRDPQAKVSFVLAASSTAPEGNFDHSVDLVLALHDLGQLGNDVRITFGLNPAPGTATVDEDYQLPAVATFLAGATSGTVVAVPVPILDDFQFEGSNPEESFTLRIESVAPVYDGGKDDTRYSAGSQRTHAVTITENDRRTQRVSVSSAGAEGNGPCDTPLSISADGRHITFLSSASDLVVGDTNGVRDVFVHDCQDGSTTRVSVDSAGAEGDNWCDSTAISADGRYVAFTSLASNLVAGDTNAAADIFVHDRQTGATTRVNLDSVGAEANDWSWSAAISADGRYVAFVSDASNLVAGDTNGTSDIFVHDRQTGQTTRVSVDSAGVEGDDWADSPSISADGRSVAFFSPSTNLVAGDTNGASDVFVHDRQTGLTVRASVSSAGAQGNGASLNPALAAGGRFVSFQSAADDLVAGDTNAKVDVFVHDLQTGQTTRESVDSAGAQVNGSSYTSALSADGRYLALRSVATDLVSGDANGADDVFLRDRQAGLTTRVSLDAAGGEGNGASVEPVITPDGRYVAFASQATDLVPGDTNGSMDIFVCAPVSVLPLTGGGALAGLPPLPAGSRPAIVAAGLQRGALAQVMVTGLVRGQAAGLYGSATGTPASASQPRSGAAALDLYAPQVLLGAAVAGADGVAVIDFVLGRDTPPVLYLQAVVGGEAPPSKTDVLTRLVLPPG